MNKLDKLSNALQNQVLVYLDGLSHEEVAKLAIFLGNDFVNKEPDETQKAFIDKFIGLKNFNKFIDEHFKQKPYFLSSVQTKSLLIEITSYVTYYCSRKLLLSDKLLKHEKALQDLLKAEVCSLLGKTILQKIIDQEEKNVKVKLTDVLIELVEGLNKLGLSDDKFNENCLLALKHLK